MNATKDFEIISVMDIRLKADKIRKEFYETREQLYRETRSYFHQSISSTYIKESKIVELTNRCEELKAEYISFRDKILDFYHDSVVDYNKIRAIF